MRPPSPKLELDSQDSNLELASPGLSDVTDLLVSDEVNAEDDPAINPALPPRIAARFCRLTNVRRSTSNASSRRTSISSTHSHQSSRSRRARESSQSTCVAQHLRRASILEDRKARLADRAAHVEKVRLRAAVAKAALRPSNLEARALAAQKARERYLAQVTAACAEEVRRAKKIAEETKEKKAAEERRLKMEMKERHAEAERRRLEYNRRNGRRTRTASVPSSTVEVKPMASEASGFIDEETAAARIQGMWRDRRRRRVINDFQSLELSIEAIHDTTFEQVGALLSQDRVLSATSKLLKLCGVRDEQGGPLGEKLAVRTFLSSFLILGHPTHVLGNDGEQEKDLITKSKDLLISFERLLSMLTPENHYTPPEPELDALSHAYAAFLSAFKAWKSCDATALIETMVAQFVELDSIWSKVKDDHPSVAAEYEKGIRDNQAVLFARMKRLVGHEKARSLVLQAIKESRKVRGQRAAPEGAVATPRGVTGSSEQRQPTEGAQSSAEMQSPSPQPSSAAAETLQSRLNPPITASAHANSRRRSVQSDQLQKIESPIPENRTLLHELAINKRFRLEMEVPSEAMLQMRRAIYQSMKNDAAAQMGHPWTLAIADNIRRRLLRLLMHGSSTYKLVSEVLDPTVIANETSRGTFSFDKFFAFMSTMLPRLCAPFRDEEIKRLTQDDTGDWTDRLARIMHGLDLLCLDYCNFLMHESAPALIKDAPGYEARRFAEDLQNGVHTLEKTHRWWMASRTQLMEEAERRDPQGIMHPGSRPTAEKIYMHGLVNLAISVGPLPVSDLPETLQLDHNRLEASRRDTLRIVVVGAILLTAKNLLKRDVRSQWKQEAVRIWETLAGGERSEMREMRERGGHHHNSNHISANAPTAALGLAPYREDAGTATQIQSIIESSHAMPPQTRAQLANTIARVLGQARRAIGLLPPSSSSSTSSSSSASAATSPTAPFSDPVMRLLLQRLRTHVFSRLSATSAGERVRHATTASEGLAGSGLPEFVSMIGNIVEQLSKVADVDRKAHGMWYDAVAAQVAGAPPSSSSSFT
ncbi:hypothetical protein L228DRAFT_266227 [Xylona heveae TC161]|uniref:Tcp11-domain-containing protein n=1 Tax=Xylona heveae (strain CBS 132557 / TC161) TaxID=1328760 RepID=A0A165J5Y2_XYLHT|nr:hypothetical protein L228DRAFT_266227 [Xylona heveae TC161]KZF25776.1 hypothetical protein L228DRAFT_266227 [Xylona heveae TC161]